ncbi:hypothetical protein AFLA70_629g000341 [Aspergillus flavus AF70]|nr:hypothetical protein AFLA70_629g000341 [Aspergillus flavus AF70]
MFPAAVAVDYAEMRKKRMALEDLVLKFERKECADKRIARALNAVAAVNMGSRKEKKTQRASSPCWENIKGEECREGRKQPPDAYRERKNNFWKRSDWIIGSAAVLRPHWPGGDPQGR